MIDRTEQGRRTLTIHWNILPHYLVELGWHLSQFLRAAGAQVLFELLSTIPLVLSFYKYLFSSNYTPGTMLTSHALPHFVFTKSCYFPILQTVKLGFGTQSCHPV